MLCLLEDDLSNLIKGWERCKLRESKKAGCANPLKQCSYEATGFQPMRINILHFFGQMENHSQIGWDMLWWLSRKELSGIWIDDKWLDLIFLCYTQKLGNVSFGIEVMLILQLLLNVNIKWLSFLVDCIPIDMQITSFQGNASNFWKFDTGWWCSLENYVRVKIICVIFAVDVVCVKQWGQIPSKISRWFILKIYFRINIPRFILIRAW